MKKRTIAIAAGAFAIALIVVMIINKPADKQATESMPDSAVSQTDTGGTDGGMPDAEYPTATETEEPTVTTTYVAPRVPTQTTTAILDTNDVPVLAPVTATAADYIGKWECTYMLSGNETISEISGLPLYFMFRTEINDDGSMSIFTRNTEDAMYEDPCTWEYVPDSGELCITRNSSGETMYLSINQDGSLIMSVEPGSSDYLYFRKVTQYTYFDAYWAFRDLYGYDDIGSEDTSDSE